MLTLQEIYDKYKTYDGWGDKGTVHSYIDEYAKLFEQYRYNCTLLEIGLAQGHSIKMWNEYFIESKIIGVDITTDQIGYLINNSKYNIIIEDATSETLLEKIMDIKFDIIIDDGSHKIEDQIKSFTILKSKIKSGGLYIIEDIQNIDNTKYIFEQLHDNCQIIDNRLIKNRYDDILIVYRF